MTSYRSDYEKYLLVADKTKMLGGTYPKYLKTKALMSSLNSMAGKQSNTYIYNGLPPKPISYVGKETLDIIFENYKTDFLFYFFNNSLNRHIFSKTYEEHKKKLNDYRSKK